MQINKDNIKAVIFDLDDTLFQTSLYYKENMIEMAEYAIKKFEGESNSKKVEEIYLKAVQIYKREKKPLLIDDLIIAAIKNIYSNNLDSDIKKFIEEKSKKFYNQSPKLHPDSIDVIKRFIDRGISIAIHSHAQPEWTDIKVKYIEKELLNKYGIKIKIPKYSSLINEKKSSDNWSKAIKKFNFDLTKTLVIGDNYEDDILSAKKAGIKHLIFINKASLDIKDKGIKQIKSIEELSTF